MPGFRLLMLLLGLAPVLALAQGPRPQPNLDPNAMILSLGGNHLVNTAFVQGGDAVATVGSDGKLRIWDLARGTQRGEAQVGRPTNNHQFQFLEHPDGKRLVVAGSHDKAYVVTLADVKVLLEIPVSVGGAMSSYAVIDEGKTLARIDRDLRFRHFDLDTGKEKEGLKLTQPPLEARASVSHLALAPDGKTYATHSFEAQGVLRDAATHEVRYRLNLDGKRKYTFHNGVYPPHFSGDGKRVVFHGTDGTLRVVDVTSGKELRSLQMEERDPRRPGIQRVIAPVAFSANGQWLLATTEGMFSELILYGVASGLEVRRLPGKVVGPTLTHVALTPRGNLMVAPGTPFDKVEVWDVEKGRLMTKTPAEK